MIYPKASQFIEDQIKIRLVENKSAYLIGKELSRQIDELFGIEISPKTLESRAEAIKRIFCASAASKLCNEIAYGYCHCGCGQKTKTAKKTYTARGYIKNEPLKYVVGHNNYVKNFIVKDKKNSWTAIPGYPGYFVSRDGKIKGAANNLLKLISNHQGYLYVNLYINRRRKKIFVHRAVLLAFIGPPDKNQETRHLDGNPKNNNIDNLKWGTKQENNKDKIVHGTTLRGERNPNSKLTELQVRDIKTRSLHCPLSSLAKQYDVNKNTIRNIALGIKWTHVG